MTQAFENMLYLFGCGATGKEPDIKNCVNLSEVRKISISQNVWPVVYSAIRKKLSSGEIKLPEEIYSALENSFNANIGRALQKNEFNKSVVKSLETNGIEYCLFKGMSLAELYDIPETRVSADMDILISPEKEEKVTAFLKQLGYSVRERKEYDHHMNAIHPVGGEIEVHVSVMRKNWDDIIFSNKICYNEPYTCLESGIKTLGINDALLNTVTHFIKHFVRSGAGVRHIMDMLLYMKKYESQIDWEKFNELMRELRYDKLIDAAKTLGVRYWGFSFEEFNEVSQDTLETMLDDMEKGGVFGETEDSRRETYAQFTKRRKNLTDTEYKKYSLNNMDKTLLQKLFPDRDYMRHAYGLKGDGIFLLIAAHIRRVASILFNIATGKKDFSRYAYGESREMTTQVKERIDLFEKLDIIDKNGEK